MRNHDAQSGTTVEEYAYDFWGNRVNPITWQPDTRTSFIINRGYTGHEHLDMFNLINMNGRVYDPVLSRFISPDNYIQAASNSQSYNRYSYCMNNPLMYSDPTGNTWWSHFTGWLGEQFDNPRVIMPALFASGIVPFGTFEVFGGSQFLNATTNASTSWLAGFIGGMGDEWFNGSSWREADRRAQNSWKISKGLYITDDGSDWNKVWQVFSRHTWQQPSTELGYRYSNFSNNIASVDVEYFRGVTVIINPMFEGGNAMSLGGYIHLSPENSTLDFSNLTLLHEYGHFLQTRDWGFLSLPGAFSSLADGVANSSDTHRKLWFEQDANARTIDYFQSSMNSQEIIDFNTKYTNQQYYDNRYFRWWYLLAPDPFFITYYNVNNNPR